MCSVFLATELFPSPLQADLTEDFELLEFEFDEIEEMIESGKLWDGMSISSWAIARNKISKLLNQ